jgi:hypothetical protein
MQPLSFAPPLETPYAPKKKQPTMSRIQELYYNNRVKNAEKLQKNGRNVANMFQPNEPNVEVFNFTPTNEYMTKTNYEPSRESIRRGMSTPPRQIKFRGPLALYPKVPNAPMKKWKTRRHRVNRRTRKTMKN